MLLLVHNEVLGTRNDTRVLDTLNGLCNGDTSEDWIRTEA